jgi:hypothetical protein
VPQLHAVLLQAAAAEDQQPKPAAIAGAEAVRNITRQHCYKQRQHKTADSAPEHHIEFAASRKCTNPTTSVMPIVTTCTPVAGLPRLQVTKLQSSTDMTCSHP